TIGRLTKNRAMIYLASALEVDGAVAGAGIGLVRTVRPSRSACSPSATTWALGSIPSSITHIDSTRGPTLTLWNATLLSGPTTATTRRTIGLIWEIVVRSVLSPRPTRLPGFTLVSPTSPSIGARTRV